MPNYIPLGIFFPQINLTFLRLWWTACQTAKDKEG